MDNGRFCRVRVAVDGNAGVAGEARVPVRTAAGETGSLRKVIGTAVGELATAGPGPISAVFKPDKRRRLDPR